MADIATMLGKITEIELGWGGYQDAQFGFTIELKGPEFSRVDFWPADENGLAAIKELLKGAKQKQMSDLVGVPVEATYDNMYFKSWRVLTEVL